MASVWAQHQQFGDVCADGSDVYPGFPAGSDSHQFGWDVGVTFSSLEELAEALDPSGPTGRARATSRILSRDVFPDGPRVGLTRGSVTRLAILCHGAPGRLFVNGAAEVAVGDSPSSGDDPLDASTACRSDHDLLHRIGLATSQSAWIFLMGCNCARGSEGETLLIALSQVWPGRTVVGYTSYGYRDPRTSTRAGSGACVLPGMRDTASVAGAGETLAAPWASAASPSAIQARDGRIINRVLWNPGVHHEPGPVTMIGPPRSSPRSRGTLGLA